MNRHIKYKKSQCYDWNKMLYEQICMNKLNIHVLKELYPLFWGCISSNLNSQPHLFFVGKTGPKKKVLVPAQGFKMGKWLYLVLELYLIIIKSAKGLRQQSTQHEMLRLCLQWQLLYLDKSRCGGRQRCCSIRVTLAHVSLILGQNPCQLLKVSHEDS